jgi:hypothetical protein
MRCGTTSLNGYLREHPEVAVSQPKEVHFFDLHFDEGLDWYAGHFPDAEGASAIGEATPDYLYHPDAVARIGATLSDVKLIVMLRNPIDRAYSHYWHNRSRGRETLEFEEAITAEPMRLTTGPEPRRIFSYLDKGRYVPQLERLYASVASDRVFVRTFEELERTPETVYADVCRFVGIDPGFRPENLGRAINAYVEFRSSRLRDVAKRLPGPLQKVIGKLNQKESSPYPPMRRDTRERLAADFAAANTGLADLVGIAIPEWS